MVPPLWTVDRNTFDLTFKNEQNFKIALSMSHPVSKTAFRTSLGQSNLLPQKVGVLV